MLLISKRILFILGTMAFLAMLGCTTTEPSLSPEPLKMTPQMDCQVVHTKLYGHYVGDCQNGKAHGQGQAVGKDKYEGTFANGMPYGQGTYTWRDKESFVGQFINGIPQIPHTGCDVVEPRLRGTYSGECRNNKAYGRGLAKGIDTYKGNFIKGVTNGEGTYIWPNGDRYIGQFKNGEPYGRGVMKYADGVEEAINN